MRRGRWGPQRANPKSPSGKTPPLGEPPRRITGGQAQVGRTSQEGKRRTSRENEDKLGGQARRTSREDKPGGQTGRPK